VVRSAEPADVDYGDVHGSCLVVGGAFVAFRRVGPRTGC
jgi:hypothetical protein